MGGSPIALQRLRVSALKLGATEMPTGLGRKEEKKNSYRLFGVHGNAVSCLFSSFRSKMEKAKPKED